MQQQHHPRVEERQWMSRLAAEVARETQFDAGDLMDLISHLAVAPEEFVRFQVRAITQIATACGYVPINATQRMSNPLDDFGRTLFSVVRDVHATYG